MQRIQQFLIALFVLILVLHCVFIYQEALLLRQISKLLLIPILLVYSMVGAKPKRGLLLALIFSFAGDALLLGNGVTYFLMGMVAFILAHMNYSFYFLHLAPVSSRSIRTLYLALAILLVVNVFVFFYLKDHLGVFTLPVISYMLFISLMAALSAHVTTAAQPLATLAWRFLLPGAILFVISDTLLAIDLFKQHHILASVAVMFTYGMAQMLLVIGAKKISTILQ